MIYDLHLLSEFWGPLRIFEYISVRTVGGAGMSFLIAVFIGPVVIRRLKQMKIGQHVREDAVMDMHRGKEGTPTMGGVIMIIAVTLSVLVWARQDSIQVWLALATMIWMGAIGFFDDYRKVVYKNSKGLSPGGKILLQSLWIVIAMTILYITPETREVVDHLMIPFKKAPLFTEMWVGFTFLFMYLVLVGTCNAVNLTDGMDGLAVGCTNSAFLAYLVMAYVAGRVDFSEYLQVPYIPGTGELAVFSGCLLGAGLGFLWYNCHPAQVFMGDTGSLALGGSLAMVAILIKQELVLIIVGGVFVAEALSVVMQILYFKVTGGKRIFRCAPIHHHFEIIAREQAVGEGRDPEVVEARITTRMWILSIVFAILGLVSLKIR